MLYAKNIVKILLSLTLFFEAPHFVLAAPNVEDANGTFVDGQSVTISGSGFGTKLNPAPVLREDFEEMVTGEIAGQNGWSYPAPGSNGVTVIDTNAHQGSKATYKLTNNTGASLLKLIPQSKNFYLSYWFKFSFTNPTADYGINQLIKQPRVIYDPNGLNYYNGAPIFTFSVAPQVGADAIRTVIDSFVTYTGGSAFSPINSFGLNHPPRPAFGPDVWHRLETYVTWRADGTGEVRHIIDGSGAPDHNFVKTSLTTLGANDQFPNTINLLHMTTRTLAGGTEVGYDDIYFDDTQTRVELCDNQTWAARTHCEIQVPSAWNDNQIQLTVNKGSFPDGQAWLFVVDENGNTSAGYPITFAATGDLTAPAAPSGLSVQ